MNEPKTHDELLSEVTRMLAGTSILLPTMAHLEAVALENAALAADRDTYKDLFHGTHAALDAQRGAAQRARAAS